MPEQSSIQYEGHTVENTIHFSSFRIRSKCWQYGTVEHYDWAVYIDIKPSHPIFQKLKPIYWHLEEGIDQWCAVDKILPNLHDGCTYFQLSTTHFTVGCDFQHAEDAPEFPNRTTITPPISVTHTIEALIRFMHEYNTRHNSILYRRFNPPCQP